MLISCGLIAETRTDSQTRTKAALSRIRRNNEGGHTMPLHIASEKVAGRGRFRHPQPTSRIPTNSMTPPPPMGGGPCLVRVLA